MLKAIEYARYSSNNQREESIDAQLRAIQAYARSNNIQIVETFTDEAITGKFDTRDNFQKMIQGILKGHYDVDLVLVHKFNRFARNKYDSAIYKKRLKEAGVKVVSVTQNIDDTPEGAMMESFLEAMDEYYSANLALEVQKGLRENALKGKHSGGKVLYGFDVDENGHYVPNENAKVVKRIFEEFAAGYPKSEICERLNREGYRNQQGKTFNVRTIYDMLRNEKYIGNFIYTIAKTETIRLDDIIPPIVDKDLWVKVQERNNKQVKARYTQKRMYHLTGKAFCEHCGSHVSGAGSKRTRDGKDLYYYYKCVGKVKHKNGCTAPSINKDWLEENVLRLVMREVMNEEKINEIARLTYAELDIMKEEPTISLEQLEKELSQIKKKQERLMELFLDGDMDKKLLDSKNDEFKQRRYSIETEIEKRKRLASSDNISVENIADYLTQFVERLKAKKETDNDEFLRAVFNAFVDKVNISDKQITVHINVDFSNMDGGDNVRKGGAIHHLPPINAQISFPRKKHIWDKNNN